MSGQMGTRSPAPETEDVVVAAAREPDATAIQARRVSSNSSPTLGVRVVVHPVRDGPQS
jgi:hypothetical protein